MYLTPESVDCWLNKMNDPIGSACVFGTVKRSFAKFLLIIIVHFSDLCPPIQVHTAHQGERRINRNTP